MGSEQTLRLNQAGLTGGILASLAMFAWRLSQRQAFAFEHDLAGVLELALTLIVPFGAGAAIGMVIPALSARFSGSGVIGFIVVFHTLAPAYTACRAGEAVTPSLLLEGVAWAVAAFGFSLAVLRASRPAVSRARNDL